MAQADALTDAQGRDDTRKAILAVWAGTHADEARAYVEALTNPARRSDSARLLGPSLMAGIDPARPPIGGCARRRPPTVPPH